MAKTNKFDFQEFGTKSSLLQEVLRHVSAANLISQKSQRYLTYCWHHREEIPSLMINCETNTYRCFGCGANGTTQDVSSHFAGLINSPLEISEQENNIENQKPLYRLTDHLEGSINFIRSKDLIIAGNQIVN